jgi:hypothetical protein
MCPTVREASSDSNPVTLNKENVSLLQVVARGWRDIHLASLPLALEGVCDFLVVVRERARNATKASSPTAISISDPDTPWG